MLEKKRWWTRLTLAHWARVNLVHVNPAPKRKPREQFRENKLRGFLVLSKQYEELRTNEPKNNGYENPI